VPRDKKTEPEIAPGVELNQDSVSGRKAEPTPSRREREAARKRPLVSDNSPEARKQARAKLNEQRERARIGMAAGEERYLPIRDRGPQKRWVRDYVDARFSPGEILIPVMFAVIILTFFPQPEVQGVGIVALWAFFAVAVVDAVLLGRRIQKRLAERFGADRVEKVRWYAAMRAFQLRMLRLPKPQVKRGAFPS
jgi:hypothetical protein